MTTIKVRDLDLATLKRLRMRALIDERSGNGAGILRIPSGATDPAAVASGPLPSDPREGPADDFVIQLDAEALEGLLNAIEARILEDRLPPTEADDQPRDRARRIRESLVNREHSDSGAIQNEDRQR